MAIYCSLGRHLLQVGCPAYIVYLHGKDKEKLIYGSGAWWDRNRNPLCLICKTPISRGFNVFGDKNLGCRKCETAFNFVDDDTGEIIELETAKEKFKK